MFDMNLFDSVNDDKDFQPLAQRLRPKSLKHFVGQLDKNLLRMIETQKFSSMILYGSSGTGKTTLAEIIANSFNGNFKKINATISGIADLKKIVNDSESQLKLFNRQTILFIDEIHRFNKSQQDFLLPFVEDGKLILIGATTENPFFEINSALLSRLRIIRLNKLSVNDIKQILINACTQENFTVDNDCLDIISDVADGDARVALNILEQTSLINQHISHDSLKDVIGNRILRYDKKSDNHYDTASTFIKSMRASDSDTAISCLAKMITCGEDIKFIARRMVIFAAEDIGNADPMALVLTNSATQAAQFVGLPEAQIILSQAVIYLANAPKDQSAYFAINSAIEKVNNGH